MSAQGFKPVFMAASVVGAALACYLVSLTVASERAKLEGVEEQIVLAQRDIRVLQTEIGTRGRLAQLERWNARFIRLSAPSADQFVEGGFQLAAMVRPNKRPTIAAPVVLAAAPAGDALARPIVTSDSADALPPGAARRGDPADLLHTASYVGPDAAALRKPPRPAVPELAPPPARRAAADPLAPLPSSNAATGARTPVSLPVKPKDPISAR